MCKSLLKPFLKYSMAPSSSLICLVEYWRNSFLFRNILSCLAFGLIFLLTVFLMVPLMLANLDGLLWLKVLPQLEVLCCLGTRSLEGRGLVGNLSSNSSMAAININIQLVCCPVLLSILFLSTSSVSTK